MHKVVVERPRGGQGWARQFPRPKVDFDDLPAYESIRRPHVHRKWFTDVLGPLRRWMHSQVGRPWNDVYSEACAVIKPDSVVRAHIKTHLLEFVERHTFMHEGTVCVLETSYRGRGIIPVTEERFGRASFFVHPETGLLCRIQPRQRLRWRDEKAERRMGTQRWLSGTVLLRQIHGLWFACEMRPFPRRFERGDSPWRFDFADRKAICRSRARDIYDHEVYCVAKRQLSRRELKHHSLTNAPTLTRSATFSRQLPCLLTIALHALASKRTALTPALSPRRGCANSALSFSTTSRVRCAFGRGDKDIS